MAVLGYEDVCVGGEGGKDEGNPYNCSPQIITRRKRSLDNAMEIWRASQFSSRLSNSDTIQYLNIQDLITWQDHFITNGKIILASK